MANIIPLSQLYIQIREIIGIIGNNCNIQLSNYSLLLLQLLSNYPLLFLVHILPIYQQYQLMGSGSLRRSGNVQNKCISFFTIYSTYGFMYIICILYVYDIYTVYVYMYMYICICIQYIYIHSMCISIYTIIYI